MACIPPKRVMYNPNTGKCYIPKYWLRQIQLYYTSYCNFEKKLKDIPTKVFGFQRGIYYAFYNIRLSYVLIYNMIYSLKKILHKNMLYMYVKTDWTKYYIKTCYTCMLRRTGYSSDIIYSMRPRHKQPCISCSEHQDFLYNVLYLVYVMTEWTMLHNMFYKIFEGVNRMLV